MYVWSTFAMWLVSLAGVLFSLIQEYLKDTRLGEVNQKGIAIFLAVLGTFLAVLSEFVFNLNLFGDISSPESLALAALAIFGTILGWSQITYGFALHNDD